MSAFLEDLHIRVECQMMNPPKPSDQLIVVLSDGKTILGGVDIERARAAVKQYDELKEVHDKRGRSA